MGDGTWNPTEYICMVCVGKMKSKYPGHFCQCECRKSFVDQTKHYGRTGGYAVVYEKNNEQVSAGLLRTLYRHGIIDFNELDRLVNILQLRMFDGHNANRRDP